MFILEQKSNKIVSRIFILKYRNAVQLNMNRFKMDKLSIVPQYKKMLVHCSKNMNYIKIYNQLIERGKTSDRQKSKDNYYENHHIIPKCIGGTNDKSNLVLLTAREHFIAHWLLTKIYPNKSGIIYALNSFCMRLKDNSLNKQRTNIPGLSKKYEVARKLISNLMRTELNPAIEYGKFIKNTTYINNGIINKRINLTDLSFYLQNGWIRGRKKFKRISPSMNTRNKIGVANKGKKPSQGSIDFFKNNKHYWVSKDGQTKQVFEKDLQKYLQDGWVRGRHVLRAKQPDEIVYFKYNDIIIQVDLEDKLLYQKYGWQETTEIAYKNRKRNTYNFKFWVNNGIKSLRICEKQKEIYLEKGYKIGRGKRRFKNV